MNIKEKVIELIESNLKENITEDTISEHISEQNLFDDLGYDSLNFIKLIVDIEEVFSIEIPDELILMENFSTITQVEKTISSILLNTGLNSGS